MVARNLGGKWVAALCVIAAGCLQSQSQQGTGGGGGGSSSLGGAGDLSGPPRPGDGMIPPSPDGVGSTGATGGTDAPFPPAFARNDGSSVDTQLQDGRTVVVLTTAPFELGPGGETFQCQNFANPVGRDLALSQTESRMNAGSHHLFAFNQPGLTDGALTTCGGLEFGPSVHAATSIDKVISYPDGVARLLSGGDGIRIQMHYFNASDVPIEGRASVTLRESAEASPQRAAGLFMNNLAIDVPPGAPGSATKTCTLPQDIQLMGLSSHMHQFGVHFEATLDDGRTLHATDDWEDPASAIFDPPLALPGGSAITFRCDYSNTTDFTLSFGESAATNEMCILTGVYYPAANGQGIVCM